MTERESHPEDMPWNDVPADSDLPLGAEDPDPGEVAERDDEAVDTASPRIPDPMEKYQPDSLDQRLAEEEPERMPGEAQAEEAGGLVDPDRGGGDVQVAEPDPDPLASPEDTSAEEAAIHIRDEDQV
jgi:hypothetical protein